MAMHICECFLQDAEDSSFQISGEPLQRLRKFQINLDIAALHKAVHIPVNRQQQSGFIEHGRMQEIGHGPDFIDGLISDTDTLGNLLS